MNEPVSQEFLNAFVDGELTADERERAIAQLDNDPDFKARVCEARTLKEQVKGAYIDLPGNSTNLNAAHSDQAWARALAAGLLLTLGLGGGWLARGTFDATPQMIRLAGLPSGYHPVSLAAHVDPNKVMLHLDSNDPYRLTATLDLAERMLVEGKGKRHVIVVASTSGLDLLRQDTSPDRTRIRRLAEQYPNLAFVACGQTIARLKREGVNVILLPDVSVASSAMNEVLSHMQQGWVYVKV